MKILKRLLFVIFLILIIIGSILFFNGYKLYKNTIDEISIDKKIAEIQSKNTYISINDVPEYYKNAVIAVEDHRFKEHGPIDIISIGRAIVSNFEAKEFNEGGSTITQQVAKNLYFITEEDVISRKIAEILVAMDLENNYSKDDILEFYINTIYFGEGYYGIYEASNGYYKKNPKDLTLDEATLLAGVPNAPSVYNPVVNPKLSRNRQQKVISSMIEYGYLDEAKAKELQE